MRQNPKKFNFRNYNKKPQDFCLATRDRIKIEKLLKFALRQACYCRQIQQLVRVTLASYIRSHGDFPDGVSMSRTGLCIQYYHYFFHIPRLAHTTYIECSTLHNMNNTVSKQLHEELQSFHWGLKIKLQWVYLLLLLGEFLKIAKL